MLTEGLVRTVNLGVLTLLLKPNRAVGPLLEAMDDPQRVQLDSLARQWATTEHEGLWVEVELRLEGQADVLLRSANQAVIEVRIVNAGELFEEAITLLPNSWKTRFGLARFHLQNGDPEHGFELLDQLGAVLRVFRGQGARLWTGAWTNRSGRGQRKLR